MKPPPNKYTIVVKYNSDPTLMIDDHESEPIYLTEINERRFKDVYEAIKFMTTCNSPITTISEIMPEIKQSKKIKLVLSDKNIKIKHQANGMMELFTEDEEDWG